jgi:hypothetical protein
MSLSRRSFVSWLGGLAATLGLGRRARAAAPDAAHAPGEPQGTPLDAALLAALGESLLPGELGPDGVRRVTRGFAQWIAAYRRDAELVHPYGSPNIRYAGASPLPTWREQLAALQREARARHRRAFTALSREERRALVAAALDGDRLNRMPDPLGASHVAVALAAWYFRSPEAADLCYRARIGRNQCRPLLNVSREPLPLARQRGTE